MGSRRRVGGYPRLGSLERTLEAKATLAGARRFFQSEGVFVLAADRVGVARLAAGAWLRPSAYRRMGNYLDMRSVSVAGWRLAQSPFRQLTLTEEKPLYQQFVEAAEGLRGRVIETDREIRLCGCGDAGLADWKWEGLLAYSHVFDLVGGERMKDEAHVPIYARPSSEGVDIALLIRRPSDLDVAWKWLSGGCDPMRRGWHLEAVALPHEDPDRSQALNAVLGSFGDLKLLAVNHPDVYRDGTTLPQASDEFLAVLQRAPYQTDMTQFDVVLSRIHSDGGILGALSVYLWHQTENAVVSVRLKQRPTDAHLSLAWQPGRLLREAAAQPPQLSSHSWRKFAPLDWQEAQKRAFLLSCWSLAARTLTAESLEYLRATA